MLNYQRVPFLKCEKHHKIHDDSWWLINQLSLSKNTFLFIIMIKPFWNVNNWWFMICKLWRTSMMIWWFWMIWLSNLLLRRWIDRWGGATFGFTRMRGRQAPWPRFEANKKIENFTIHAKCAEGYKGWGWERGGKCVETWKHDLGEGIYDTMEHDWKLSVHGIMKLHTIITFTYHY